MSASWEADGRADWTDRERGEEEEDENLMSRRDKRDYKELCV